MANRVWQFSLDGQPFTVQLEHGVVSGSRKIWVNGKVVEQSKKLLDTGSEHAFRIGPYTCGVFIKTNGVTFSYELVVNGRSLGGGEKVKRGQAPQLSGDFNLPDPFAQYEPVDTSTLGATPFSQKATGPVPGWAWFFILACAVIPVITLGGALPAALGIGGAAGCAAVARDRSKSAETRVWLCIFITVGVWAMFFVLIILFAAVMA